MKRSILMANATLALAIPSVARFGNAPLLQIDRERENVFHDNNGTSKPAADSAKKGSRRI